MLSDKRALGIANESRSTLASRHVGRTRQKRGNSNRGPCDALRSHRILTTAKRVWGDRVTTVFPHQGKFAHDPIIVAANPAVDVTVERIDDLLAMKLPMLLGSKMQSPRKAKL